MRAVIAKYSLLLLPVFLGFSQSYSGEITPQLQALLDSYSDKTAPVSVIVQFKDKFDLPNFQKNSVNLPIELLRKKLLDDLHTKGQANSATITSFLKGTGVDNPKNLWITSQFAMKIPANKVSSLANRTSVESIDIDKIFQALGTIATAATIPQWNLMQINIPELWTLGYTGQGVVVANMDTGVDLNHQDLKFKWRGGANSWYDPYSLSATPIDKNGHGTQTMGIMVGGDLSGTSIGVAPDAQWIAARIFDDFNLSTESNIHSAFQWLIDPDSDSATNDAPNIVNASWGIMGSEGLCNQIFSMDIQLLRASNIAIVFSAGNSGPSSNTSLSPANSVNTLAVGSTNQTGNVSIFSSRGPSPCNGGFFPNIVAPGEIIFTSDLTFGGVFPNSYSSVSGTSFAAPHVAGTMALLLSSNSNLTVLELENAIMQSAADILPIGPDNDSGVGQLDGLAALNQTQADSDLDSILDIDDNCIFTANMSQTDTDLDNIGNACDADFNNDGIVNTGDLNIFRNMFLSADPLGDLNNDGVVNTGDLNIIRNYYLSVPGPSALSDF